MKYLVCMGVARSGTTFMSELLNSHGQVFCGNELLKLEDFRPEMFTKDGFTRKSRRLLRKKELEKFATVQVVGDKQPRAYLILEQLFDRFEDLKVILMMRDPADVCASWNSRADAPQENWPAHRLGAISLIDQLALCSLLHGVTPDLGKRVLLVSYSAIMSSAGQAAVAKRIFDFLGVASSPEVELFLREQEGKTASVAGKSRRISDAEQRLIQYAGLRPLVEYMDRNAWASLTDAQPALAAVLSGFDRRADEFWAQLDAALCSYPCANESLEAALNVLRIISRLNPQGMHRPGIGSVVSQSRNDTISLYARCLLGQSADEQADLAALLQRCPESACVRKLIRRKSKAGKVAKSVEQARSDVESNPHSVALRFGLAKVLARAGKPYAARQELARIEQLAPSDPLAQQRRERISKIIKGVKKRTRPEG